MDTTIEKVLFLQKIEMFSDVPSEQLAHLAAISKLVDFDKGETIFKENDTSDSLYLLIEGNVQLRRENKITKEISRPEAIGAWGFFDEEPRLVTAECSEKSQFLKIDSIDFFDLLENRVHLSRGLLKYFAKRIRKLVEVADTLV